MSCSQVMYQPYSSYFPYPQRPSATGHQSSTASLFGANSFSPMDTSNRSGLAFSESSSSINAINTNSLTSGVPSRKLIDTSPPPSQSSTSNSRIKDNSSPKESVSAIRSAAGERRSSSSSGTVGSQSAAGTLSDSAADAHYISANCVVFTYFSGDSSSVVDQHFSRALSQQTYNSSDKSSKDATVPMSQRSFPPSFWNINHPPVLTAPAHHHSIHASSSSSGLCLPTPGSSSASQVHELYASAADAYHHSGAIHPATLHHQNDPWHYTLSASAAANPYSAHHHHHRAAASAIHDLSSYSSASNRFNAQYSSLLLQPASMRSTRLTPVSATCTGFEKAAPDMSWPTSARYHHEATMNFPGHHSMDPSNYSASAAYGAAMSAAMSDQNNIYDLYKLSATQCMRTSYR